MAMTVCGFTREEAINYLIEEATRDNCKIQKVKDYRELSYMFEITSGIDYIMDMGDKPKDSVKYRYKNISDYTLQDRFKENEIQDKKSHLISKGMKLRLYEKIVNKRTTWESLEVAIEEAEKLAAETMAKIMTD